MKNEDFDLTLAKECAAAFAGATGLGCIVSHKSGGLLAEYGYGCASCRLCHMVGRPQSQCIRAQNYSMAEAERFGGKYIYYCPMGLTCFVSPILGEVSSCARITAGPFLMVEREDYIDCELTALSPELRQTVIAELERVPVATPNRVNQLSTLLFMAVGFMNKVSASNRLLETQSSDAIQGQISSYILHLKQESMPPPYPMALEKAFLKSIHQSDKAEAQHLLNELLGHILFVSAPLAGHRPGGHGADAALRPGGGPAGLGQGRRDGEQPDGQHFPVFRRPPRPGHPPVHAVHRDPLL